MDRRKALGQTGILVGSLMIAPSLFTACKNGKKSGDATTYQGDMAKMLGQVSNTMLPDTPDSPGALAAGNGPAMAQIVANCWSVEEEASLGQLLNQIDDKADAHFDTLFVDLDSQQKLQVLNAFDAEQKESYVKLKELVVYTYFTSEIGMNKAMRYLEVPGHFDGCLPYNKGDKGWAWNFFTY